VSAGGVRALLLVALLQSWVGIGLAVGSLWAHGLPMVIVMNAAGVFMAACGLASTIIMFRTDRS